MSYRPTISVYLRGKIIDIGYYRNWRDKYLFLEAMAIAAFFGDCRTRREYLNRRYGAGDVCYNVYPEIFDSSEESLKELEGCSEMPVLVDLTAQCIYAAVGALPAEKLAEKPSILDDLPCYGYRTVIKKVPRPEGARRWADGDDLWPCLLDYDWEKTEEPVTDLRQISTRSDFYALLDNCRIPYGQMCMEEIRRCYVEWTKDGTEGLSEDTLFGIRRSLEREKRKNVDCEGAEKTIYFRR